MTHASPGGPGAPARPAARRGHRAPGLAVAVVAGAGVLLLWRLFVATRTGQLLEEAAFHGSLYGASRLWTVAEPVLDVISVPFIAIVLVSAMALAVARRRATLALQVAVVMGGANLTTQVLKHWALDRPDHDVGDRLVNTLPSGHTTAAASVSAALLFVVPRRYRPAAALVGAVYTLATGISTLVGQWHRPSDVAAGVLVVVAWAGVAAALDVDGRPASPVRRVPRGAVLLLLAGGGAVGAAGATVALSRSRADVLAGELLDSRAELLQAYVGGALGVVAVVGLGFALMLLVVDAAEARRVRLPVASVPSQGPHGSVRAPAHGTDEPARPADLPARDGRQVAGRP